DRQRRDLPCQFGSTIPRVCIPLSRDRPRNLGDESGLSVGCGPEAPQMTHVHAVDGQIMGGTRDQHGLGVKETTKAGGDEPGIDERVDQVRVDPRLVDDVLSGQAPEGIGTEIIRLRARNALRPGRGRRAVVDPSAIAASRASSSSRITLRGR
ncbi:hypothetical protein, partial [Acinetobacter baumannii]|uniref:hypothetical protein n=1 Tax=Acinetobacter baumannii TaxID=470 RepID=UPI0020903DDD